MILVRAASGGTWYERKVMEGRRAVGISVCPLGPIVTWPDHHWCHLLLMCINAGAWVLGTKCEVFVSTFKLPQSRWLDMAD